MPVLIAEQAKAATVSTRLRNEFGVHINYIHPVVWQGGKVWAIGSRVYPGRRREETFHEFILHVLRSELGKEWYERQLALPEQDRHFVMECFAKWSSFTKSHTNPAALMAPGVYSADPNGSVLYLLALAWDVATLIHTTALPEKLMSRLRSHDQFQGARYEVAIAAMFARLDCEIVFQDEAENLGGNKRVEFIATHRPTGQEIAVEAKSRHRAGVLNRPGERAVDFLAKDARAVKQLFVRALEKAPESTPFIIFLDINAPVNDAGMEGRWQRDLRTWLDEMPPATAEDPCAYNGLYVTNFSTHYDEGAITRGTEGAFQIPTQVRTPLKAPLYEELHRAISNYGRVPAFAEDGALLG